MSTFPEFTATGRVVFCKLNEGGLRFSLCVLSEGVEQSPEDKETPAQMVARACHNLFHPEAVR